MGKDDTSKFLPLTEATYYIMLALAEPLHGYGVMQRIDEMSGGEVVVGPGTLYGALSTLEQHKLIVKVSEQERRKSYVLTAKGRRVLVAQLSRLETMVRRGQDALERPEEDRGGGDE